jgi:acetamidase/formamidase
MLTIVGPERSGFHGPRARTASTGGTGRNVPGMATHYFPTDEVHFTWDAGSAPVITVADGDTVVFETRDVSDNQIGPGSDTSVIAGLDWDRVYPLAGPVAVEGAEPGDILAIDILDIHTRGWGWTAILPGLGLLPEDFPDPYLRVFDLTHGDIVYFRDDIVIPLDPFFGTMGVCPASASAQPVMPPGKFGGNMDTRQLTAGTTLYLPIEVAGANFSCGDAHGCQGDGEICVTGLEAPMYAALRFRVETGHSIPFPQYRTAGPLTPLVDDGRFFGTTGIGPDLYTNAQNATRAMIDHLTAHYDLSPEDAYLLCSLVVDLKISEIFGYEIS